MIVRKDYLRASKVMKQRVEERENIEILFNCNTVGLFGEDGVEGAKVVRFKGTDHEELFDLPIDGFFLAIGHKPNTDIFADWLELDEQGYIKVDSPSTKTNIEGVYAAGDCADPTYRQAISAAGTGCRAALDAEHFLMSHNEIE
jgi:thioredoxin reductase (NADPH)